MEQAFMDGLLAALAVEKRAQDVAKPPPIPKPKKRKKERRERGIETAMAPAAAIAGGAAGAASLPAIQKRMGPKMDLETLRQKVMPGDIVLSGRKSDFARLDPKRDLGTRAERIFYRALKPTTGAYTPHGHVVGEHGYVPGSGLGIAVMHQGEKAVKEELKDIWRKSDRFVVLRPKKEVSRKKLQKVFSWAEKKTKAEVPYGDVAAAAHGAGGIVVPKKLRDVCTVRGGKLFCTAFPARAYEQAGVPIVKGKARAALAKDVLKSPHLKAVGWGGAPISKTEFAQVQVLPRAIRGAAWAGAAGAGAYGLSKVISALRKKKKKKTTAKMLKQWKKPDEGIKKAAAAVRKRAREMKLPHVKPEMEVLMERARGAPAAPKSTPSGYYGT